MHICRHDLGVIYRWYRWEENHQSVYKIIWPERNTELKKRQNGTKEWNTFACIISSVSVICFGSIKLHISNCTEVFIIICHQIEHSIQFHWISVLYKDYGYPPCLFSPLSSVFMAFVQHPQFSCWALCAMRHLWVAGCLDAFWSLCQNFKCVHIMLKDLNIAGPLLCASMLAWVSVLVALSQSGVCLSPRCSSNQWLSRSQQCQWHSHL